MNQTYLQINTEYSVNAILDCGFKAYWTQE